MCHVRVCGGCGGVVEVGGAGRVPASHPCRLLTQNHQHRWPIRHRRTAAVAGSRAGRACASACGGTGAVASRRWPDRRGRLLRGRRGGLDRCRRRSRSSGSGGRWPHSAVGGEAVRIGACVQSAVACMGTELATYVGERRMLCASARFVALLRLRRPEPAASLSQVRPLAASRPLVRRPRRRRWSCCSQ
jgi:hypothetical protein